MSEFIGDVGAGKTVPLIAASFHARMASRLARLGPAYRSNRDLDCGDLPLVGAEALA